MGNTFKLLILPFKSPIKPESKTTYIVPYTDDLLWLVQNDRLVAPSDFETAGDLYFAEDDFAGRITWRGEENGIMIWMGRVQQVI